MRNDNYYENTKKIEPKEQLSKERKKSYKIQIAGIIVAALIAIITTFMTIFSTEIRKFAYDLFNTQESTTQSSPADEPLPNNDVFTTDDSLTKNEITEKSTTKKNSSSNESITEKVTTKTSKKATSSTTTETTINKAKIIKPKVSLGTKVDSIEFLQIESDNVFVKNKVSANVETFYDGFEKQYKEKSSDSSYIGFNVDGYGMCCTIPLKSNGNLYYSGEVCDYSKISVGQEESYDKYKLHCFMGINEDNQMILGFSFEKPLSKGTYYCLFPIYDLDNGKSDNIYIKFRIH